MDYHCLVDDKLAFSLYVSGLGFPTPRTLVIGDRDSVTWIETEQRRGLDSLFEKDLDVFCKELRGEGGRGVFPLKVSSGNVLRWAGAVSG